MTIYIAVAYTHSGAYHSYYVFLTEPEWDTISSSWEPTGDFFNVCGKSLKNTLHLNRLPHFDPPELFQVYLGTPKHTKTILPKHYKTR